MFLPINPSLLIQNTANFSYLYSRKSCINCVNFTEIEQGNRQKVCKFCDVSGFWARNPQIWPIKMKSGTRPSLCQVSRQLVERVTAVGKKPQNRHRSEFNTSAAVAGKTVHEDLHILSMSKCNKCNKH